MTRTTADVIYRHDNNNIEVSIKKIKRNTKKEIKALLFDCLLDRMFREGLEDSYILNGISFKGLNNMTDKELLQQFLTVSGEDEDMYVRALAEIGISCIDELK
jgi:hypothetical protein